jgi:endonuclease YncB( thermonuclease family)
VSDRAVSRLNNKGVKHHPMRRHVIAAGTVASLILFATGCADDTPELVERSEPAEAGKIVDTEDTRRPIQAEGSASGREEATVTVVIDGDTFDAAFADGVVERVRLPQVDTPEVDDCGYEEATAVLEQLIGGHHVTLAATAAGPDRETHGRLLRAVKVDGEDVGQRLLRSGLARWTRSYADEDARLAAMYSAAESRAREASAGLWSTCGW